MKLLKLTIGIICLLFYSAIYAQEADSNVVLGKSVEASSNDEQSSYMVDGDSSTFWESAESYKHTIVFDLEDTYSISELRIKWLDGAACVAYTISYSEDGVNWFGSTSYENQTDTIESVWSDLSVNARYVQLVLRGRMTGHTTYKIGEFEVTGSQRTNETLQPITASSNNDLALLMIDNDDNTYWESTASYKHTIIVDLFAIQDINNIRIKWTDGAACVAYTISYSEDGTNWYNSTSYENQTEDDETILTDLHKTARYVQLVLRGRMNGNSTYKIAEFQVQTSSANIALNRTVVTRINSATGDYSNIETAYLITDGDSTTYWEGTNNYKISIMIDLGHVFTVTKMVIKWVDGAACVSCDIYYGEAESSMQRVFSQNGLTETVESVHEITGSARYVQLLTRGRVDGKNYRISEIEIYSNYVPHVNTEEEQAAIDTITQRLIATNLASGFDDEAALTYSNTMNLDGSWSDVDYDDKISADGWSPSTHLNRLKMMARSFRNSGSSWFENEDLLSKIQQGLLYYKTQSPSCTDNWWYDAIGEPQIYMIPLLLIKGYIPSETLQLLSAPLKDQVDSYLGGGQNLSWIAEIAAYKGCAENNYSTIEHAFEGMASNLTIVSVQGNEGIKIDGSFHQHHAQLYSGGYGRSTAEDVSEFMELAEGTLFSAMFDSEKKEIYKNLLLEGELLLGYRKTMDFGSVGRNISRTSYSYRTVVSDDLLNRAIVSDPDNAAIYQGWLNHANSSTAFPLPGRNKYFWKSDIMTQHGEYYYMSAKIISNRTYGTECLNNENLKGYNLPLGATNIMTSSSEYKGIFPVWDWTRVPGTTAIQNPDSTLLSGYLIGSNTFGGGVSNDSDGIVAYDHNYRGVMAKKAYFFVDGMLYCMGSGITSDGDDNVITSVNQCLLADDVVINKGNTAQLASQTSSTLQNLNWVYHDNVGYIFPETATITVQNIAQSGSWYDINNLTGDASLIEKNVFSVWFDHGESPSNASYQYIIVPDVTLADFETFVEDDGFVVARNNTSVQAIRRGDKYGFVFYEAGSVTMDDGLEVSSDKPAVVFIDVTDTEYKISVADPTYSESEITLGINKTFESVSTSIEDTTTSNITFDLPTGDYAGSTVTYSFVVEDLTTSVTWYGSKPIEERGLSNKILNSETEIYVYPNPAQGAAKVYFPSGNFEKLELINGAGNVLIQKSISKNDTEINIDVQKWTSGVYVVRLSGSGKAASKILLISK